MNARICYVCYSSPEPDAAALAQAINSHRPAGQEAAAQPTGQNGLAVPMSGGTVTFGTMPAPYPAHELSDDLAQRMAWPSWQADSATWRSHVIATLVGPNESFETLRERASNLLRVAAVVAVRTGASGIGWSANMLFHPTASLTAALLPGIVPANLVVRCLWRGTPEASAGGLGLRTLGLRAFELPEIDHPPTGEDPAAIYNRVMNLCAHVLAKGPVLQHGDTIGTDTHASTRIRHMQDPQGEIVVVLERETSR